MKSWKKHGYAVAAASMLLSLLVLGAAVAEDPSYVETIESWQAEREVNLKKDSSWLTVAALYWLREGENWVRVPQVQTTLCYQKARRLMSLGCSSSKTAPQRSRPLTASP